jgi:hypothetical protein
MDAAASALTSGDPSEQPSLKDGRHIRLAKVVTFDDDRVVYGAIKILSVDFLPEYQAISYHWDKSLPDQTIHIGDRNLVINGAAASALRWFARQYPSRYVWIDHLCISQDDLEEKSIQIRLMGLIFSEAEKVIAWLGDPDLSSDLAFAWADDLFVAVDDACGWDYEKLEYLQSTVNRILRKQASPKEVSPPEWFAFGRLMRRKYWERMWVVQELALANFCLVVCGSASMALWRLTCVVSATAHLLPDLTRDSDHVSGERMILTQPSIMSTALRIRAARNRSQPQGLGSLLRSCRFLLASEPHDMVYALLGLVPATDSQKIVPNYENPVEDVFVASTEYVLTKSEPRSLELLQCAGIGLERRLMKLPSWVPDFSGFQPTHPPNLIEFFYDRKENRYQPTSIDAHLTFDSSRRSLSLKGRIVAEVTEVLPQEPQGWYDAENGIMPKEIHHSQFAWLGVVAAFFARLFPNNEDVFIDAMWRTLIADYGVKEASPSRAKAGWKEDVFETWALMCNLSLDVIMADRNIIKDAAIAILKKEQPLLGKFVHAAIKSSTLLYARSRMPHRERRVFATQNGLPGLGLPLMMEGDMVSLIYGAVTPFLIRKTETEGEYLLVGECYVHGIMDGQGMTMGKEIEIILV